MAFVSVAQAEAWGSGVAPNREAKSESLTPIMTTRMEDILDRLPHRPPFRFLTDRIELTDGDSGAAVWRVTGDEAFFAGHFPGTPIVPGVLIGEALAQLSGLIVAERLDPSGSDADRARKPRVPSAGKLAHLELRFSSAVAPPAEIELTSRLERVVGALWQFEVAARAGDQRVARGGLTLAIPQPPSESDGCAS